MTLRLLFVLVAAFSVVAGQFMSDQGPEDVHFHVARALNKVIRKQMGSLQTYVLMRAKYAKRLSMKPEQRMKLEKVIMMKYTSFLVMVNFSAERDLAPKVDTIETANFSKCDETYSCWKVVLRMERDVYKAFTDLYSSAAGHADAATQAMIVPLIKQQLKLIRYHKERVVAIERTLIEKENSIQPAENTDQEQFSDYTATGTPTSI